MGLFSKKHVIVIKRDYDIKWDEEDVKALREFLGTPSGTKLQGLLEDVILNLSLNRHDVGTDFRNGFVHCYSYLTSLKGRERTNTGAVKMKGPTTIQFEAEDGETSTIPTVRG